MQIYRTYAREIITDFRPIVASFCNKPKGGLWGCRGSEWYDWCQAEEFSDVHTYFEWQLKEGSKVYVIENENDFVYLLSKYPHTAEVGFIEDFKAVYDSIDYMKMWADGYDAVELTDEANARLHMGLGGLGTISEGYKPKNIATANLISSKQYTGALLMGLNSWDVPSICVFDPKKSVIITSKLKDQLTGKEVVEFEPEVPLEGGFRYVNY